MRKTCSRCHDYFDPEGGSCIVLCDLHGAAPELLRLCKEMLEMAETAMEEEDPQACTQMEWHAEPLRSLRRIICAAEPPAPQRQKNDA